MKLPFTSLIFLFIGLLFNNLIGQCSIEQSIAIPDLNPVAANLIVGGAINNDLSASQGVCGISLKFNHQQVGDLTIELTSPSGQSVTLVGPTGSYGNTSFTDWDILFVPCGEAAAPDPGFNSKWNNDQSWGVLGDYTGSYHPYLGCLEDFNTGPVNGIWNIKIVDNQLFDGGNLIDATIFFCDPAGLSCNLCEAYAGVFDQQILNVCLSDPSNLLLAPSFPNGTPTNDYAFYYIVRQGQTINYISKSLDMAGYPAGNYSVCGFSILKTDESQIPNLEALSYNDLLNAIEGNNPLVCGDINEICADLILDQAPVTTDLEITICAGSSYNLGGNSYSTPNIYNVVVPQSNGCDSIYNLDLKNVSLQALITSTQTTITCAQPSIILSGNGSNFSASTIFKWTSSVGGFVGNTDGTTAEVNQAGTYKLTISEGNCISESTIQIFSDGNTPTINLVGGTITCANPEVNINLSSPDMLTSYSWVGPNGFTSMLKDITVSVPGLYTVSVISSNGCVASKSIIINQAGDVPLIQLSAQTISCSEPQVAINVSASSNSLSYNWTGPNGFIFNGKIPIVSEPGIYNVVATDGFGCEGFAFIEIFGSSGSLVYDLDYENLECQFGTTTLSITINDPNAFVEWTFPNGIKKIGQTVETDIPGNFQVKIVSNGCQEDESFIIIKDLSNLPVGTIVQDNVVDCINKESFLTINISQNQANVNYYVWYGPTGYIDNTQSITAKVSGLYTVYIYNFNGCYVQYNYNLQFDTDVPVILGQAFPLTCKDLNPKIVVTATQDYSYSWTGPNNYVSTDSIISGLELGGYYLIVTNSLGCTRDYFYNILADTIARDPNLTNSGIINCIQDSVTISPTFKAFTNILWNSNNGFSGSTIDIEVDQPGIYFFEAEGSVNGCISKDTIEVVKDITVPDLSFMNQSFDCGQDALILEAITNTSNVTYFWTGPNGFTSNISKPLITEEGTYTLVLTGSNGCQTSGDIVITANSLLPDVNASYSNDIDCINTSSILTGISSTSGVSFSWKGPNNIYSDPVINVDVPGDYTFIVTGTNSCSDSITINIPFTGSYPEFNALSDTLFCDKSNIFIDGLEITPNVNFSWVGPNGFSSGDLKNEVFEEGIYILTGVGSNSCVTIDTAFVVIDNIPAVIDLAQPFDTLDCNLTEIDIVLNSDKNLKLAVWTGPNSFSSDMKDINITEGGSYEFTGTANNNCETTFIVEVFQNISLPVFAIESTEINCDNTKSEITLTNSDSGAEYEWVGENFFSDLKSPVVDEAGNYTVKVIGSNGCSDTLTVEVFDDFTKPDLVTKNDTLPCDGSPVELSAITQTVGAIINWIGPNNFEFVGSFPIVSTPGTYFIEVVGPNGCSTNKSINVSDIPVFPAFEIMKSSEITCRFPEVTFEAIDILDDKDFTWYGPEGFTTKDITFNTDNAGMYYLEVEGSSGCILKDSVNLTVDTLAPFIEIKQIGRIICDIDEANISGTGTSSGVEFKYKWTTEDGNISFGDNTLNPKIQGVGTYKLEVFNDKNGCYSSKFINVQEEVSSLIGAETVIKSQTCKNFIDGEIEVINVNGGIAPYRYALPGISFSQNNVFDQLTAGEYLLSVKDSFGCVVESLINVGVERDIQVDLGPDLDIDLGQEISLVAAVNFPTNEILELIWEPAKIINCDACLKFDFKPGQNMVAKVVIEDLFGCTTEDNIIIRVDEDINLYVPNIFTPNEDGVNDIFVISQSKNIERINYFNVYDRWGSKVFSDENFVPGLGKTWDGKHLGNKVQEGVFIYIAELKMVNGKNKIIKGNITVLR